MDAELWFPSRTRLPSQYGYSTSERRCGTILNARASIPLRAQDGLEPGGAILYALLLTSPRPAYATCAPGFPAQAVERIGASLLLRV
jgi:hypothetical protein